MEATLLTAPQRDNAFRILLTIVALFGVVQLSGVGLFYAERARAARQLAGPSVTATQTATPAAKSPGTAASTTTAPTTTTTEPTAAPQATPSNAALSAGETLLREATELRERGDTANALARLEEASKKEPKNAQILSEMAMIYESMQNLTRSNETWRRIQEIGPSAGALYELADMKLRVGVPAPAETNGAGLVGAAPLESSATHSDNDGIPDGSTFGITEVSSTPNEDPDSETNLTLKIGVKARPKTALDHTKVKIQVFFYDTLDNNKIALTDADVNYEWLTPHHDWKESNPEVLAVTYVRAKKGLSSDAALTAAAAEVKPSASSRRSRSGKKSEPATGGGDGIQRKYLGYIVRIYYNDQLQAVRAEPTKLLNLFPPPFTAPST